MMEKKHRRFRFLELLLFIAAVVLGMMTIDSYKGVGGQHQSDNIVLLKTGWYYQDGEKKVATELPALIQTKPGESLTLFYDVEDLMMNGMTLSTKGALYDVRMEVRSRYSEATEIFHEQKLGELKPEEPEPLEPKPEEPKPLEPKPLEQEPEEPKSLEPEPEEPKPLELKSEEPKPLELKPEELEEPKSLEPKPEEPKQLEPKPIEPTSADQTDTLILFQYQDEAFERNDQMAEKLYCEAVLPLDVCGKTIALTFSGSESGHYQIEPVYCGTDSGLLHFHLQEDLVVILMVTAMFVLSIFSMAVSIYLRFTKMKDCRFMFAGMFMLLCGIWCITDLSLVQQLTGLSPVTNFLSFAAFMGMPIPMIYFVRTTEEMKRYRILEILVKVFYLNLVIQMVLNLAGIYQFIEMLFVTHSLLVGGVLLLAALLYYENKRKPGEHLRTILKSFVIVGFGGVLALGFYYLIPNIPYEVIYEGGILIFMIYLLYSIAKEVVGTMKFRTEIAAIQRLSGTDNLTGMGNRRALDSFLMQFEGQSGECSNALMMIFDIQKLKDINNQLGHNAGDEMIISASRCICHVFAEKGHCFRSGGGTFYVILVNPEEAAEVWDARLTEELNHYNNTSRNRMTVARGFSLLAEHGVRKNISNWKYDAEQSLYHNKGWRRIDELEYSDGEVRRDGKSNV